MASARGKVWVSGGHLSAALTTLFINRFQFRVQPVSEWTQRLSIQSQFGQILTETFAGDNYTHIKLPLQ